MLPTQRRVLGSPTRTLLKGASRNVLRTSTQLLSKTQYRSLTIKDLDSGKDQRERIVILGSGWAGYTLSRELDHRQYQVVVVSPRSYFVFTPLLASCSVGTLEFRTALEPVRSRKGGTNYFQAWADGVDFANKRIEIEEAVGDPTGAMALTTDRHAGESAEEREKRIAQDTKKGKVFSMTWDRLVVAVGCYSQTFGFEAAALPTTSIEMRKMLLHFAVVGGGPTGIEFSAELHDIIVEDLAKLYPDLMQYYKITVYDVAEKVLPMFDKKLGEYAMKTFRRENIDIKTSHHVQELRKGAPSSVQDRGDFHENEDCYTIRVKEEGEVGIGMCVWSTGLMMNPFVQKALGQPVNLPVDNVEITKGADKKDRPWLVKKHPRNGGIITNDRLRVVLEPGKDVGEGRAVLKDVYAVGDCAVMEDTMYPATAQVANQKARWLAKRLNKRDIDQNGFTYKNLGVMAYIGNWNAIMQSSGGDVSGRIAWFIWRGAYLAKAVSWRNKILIPTYWFINWIFGRDISRF
ncbi:hypothetical protein H2203_004138 [Taxawa tesnikishii (nom. ined.)]|nr:hypothetical protein H2203_004138 [Dothideales sp. JES 119]